MRGCRADRWPNGMPRHQADVSHAYQVLKKGGVPDERIVRFTDSSSAAPLVIGRSEAGAACGCKAAPR